MDNEIQNTVATKMDLLTKELDQFGLYTLSSSVSVAGPGEMLGEGEESSPDKELIQDGKVLVIADVMLTIGDLAWAKRTLDPALDQLERSMDEEFHDEDETIAKMYTEDMREGWDDW